MPHETYDNQCRDRRKNAMQITAEQAIEWMPTTWWEVQADGRVKIVYDVSRDISDFLALLQKAYDMGYEECAKQEDSNHIDAQEWESIRETQA